MKIILEQADIEILQNKIGALPVFATNISQTIATAKAVDNLINWLGKKVITEEAEQNDPS
jgi:hypothetical protein